MTYTYVLNVLAYPVLLWAILSQNIILILISISLMITHDVIICQHIRELKSQNRSFVLSKSKLIEGGKNETRL